MLAVPVGSEMTCGPPADTAGVGRADTPVGPAEHVLGLRPDPGWAATARASGGRVHGLQDSVREPDSACGCRQWCPCRSSGGWGCGPRVGSAMIVGRVGVWSSDGGRRGLGPRGWAARVGISRSLGLCCGWPGAMRWGYRRTIGELAGLGTASSIRPGLGASCPAPGSGPCAAPCGRRA